jgi:ParB family chromosome partitioning protein
LAAEHNAPPSAHPIAAITRIGDVLDKVEKRTSRADEIERMLADGDYILDIAPSLIDPSPLRDRIDDPTTPEEAEFRRSIAEDGQRVPVLLRPHTKDDGRYLTVYGHRRISALAALGRPVRAIVAAIDDAEALEIQGQENNARRNTSFIERALYARRLRDAGLPHARIAAALGVARPLITMIVALADEIPEPLILAIGPAPDIGRPRWAALAPLAKTHPALWPKIVAETEFRSAPSNQRFATVFAALSETSDRPRPAISTLTDPDGSVYSTLSRSKKDVTFRLPISPPAPSRVDRLSFPEWIEARLANLRRDYLAGN